MSGRQNLIGVERKVIVRHKNGTNFTTTISLGEISIKESNVKFIATFRMNDDNNDGENNDERDKIEIFENNMSGLKVNRSGSSGSGSGSIGDTNREEKEEKRLSTTNLDFELKKHQIIIESNFKDPLITLNLTKEKLNLKLNEMKLNLKEMLNENFNEIKLQINNLNQQEEIMMRDIKYLKEKIIIEKETIQDIEEELSFYRNDDNHEDIKKVLNNEIGYEALLEFSKNENIEILILFYKDAENFKNSIIQLDDLKIESKLIFEKYLNSNKIQISNHLFNFIKNNLNTPTKNLFISVQSDVLNKLKNVSFITNNYYIYIF